MHQVIRSQSPQPLPLRAEVSLTRRGRSGLAAGLTLVEMLVAMAITLLIMAAVVTVFANVTSSVTNRRATIEMASALRNVRATLTRDLAGATCPAVPWQRPEANHGYLEIIEGPQNDYYPTPFLFDGDGDGLADPVRTGANPLPGIDLATSSLPGSDLGGDPINDIEGTGASIGSNTLLGEETPTDGRGLGDADDILMLTVRNEDEPFVGQIPNVHNPPDSFGPSSPGVSFASWSQSAQGVESQLAEVVWFAVENPVDPNRTFAFGEPGYRTIYRRTLLILPELDYQIYVTSSGVAPTAVTGSVAAEPGTVRVFQPSVGQGLVARALAGLIAFQERYDLSVRLEWDAKLPGANGGRWVLRANSLADLTKRENRYEHHGFVPQPETLPVRHNVTRAGAGRFFPFAVASAGLHRQSTTLPVVLIADGELPSTPAGGIVAIATPVDSNGLVVAYQLEDDDAFGNYEARPLAIVNDQTDLPATARAILNEDGQIVHVTTGLAPLGGNRRGDDIIMTDALSFDLKLYDPGAPVYGYVPDASNPAEQMIQPGDPAWARAYLLDVPVSPTSNLPGNSPGTFPFARQGAYVDPGYRFSFVDPGNNDRITNRYTKVRLPDRWDLAEAAGLLRARFFNDGLIRTAVGPFNTTPSALTRRFACYDTWSTHYESNGLNEDGDIIDSDLEDGNPIAGLLRVGPNAGEPAMTDEGVNGLDDPSLYDGVIATRFGPDDDAERETRPPYDTALRGMQATLRVYERDSRQIREVRIRESFVSE